MIRKNIYQSLMAVVIAIVVIVSTFELNYQRQLDETTSEQLAEISVIYAQINVEISQIDWRQPNAHEHLLTRLSQISKVKNMQIIQDSTSLSGRLRNTQQFSLALPAIHKDQNTNYLFFDMKLANDSNQLLTIELAFILIILIGGLLLFFLYRFKWVEQLEDYANHVLSGENNRPIDMKKSFPNIISHALNQLILNNIHMTKDKIELAEKIRKTSYIDEVTELGNHSFFKAELQVRLHNRDEAESGLVAIMSFVDADTRERQSLKEEQQIEIAHVLKRFVDDIEHSVVAKLKNSEYALLLPYLTADQIDNFCKKLIQQLSKTVFNQLKHREHFIDIGLSNYKQGFGYYNIMSEADMALRNAQLQGANSWFVYGEPLSESKTKGSLRWRDFLQKVLDKREILLFAQRIHYFSQDGYLHREVLSRIAEDKQILPADQFLVMANQCGLSAKFDRLIIDEVTKYILHQDKNNPKEKYSINLFISSLLDKQFTHWLISKLSSYPQLSQQLIFEISENHLSKNIELVMPVMRQLSELGISWSVEHFGAPEQNLNYLSMVKVAMVKVDRRIINNISTSKEQQLLLSSIIVSLKSRNIAIFAEGVEKESDANYLESLDIDGAQGYFFDKPILLEPLKIAISEI